MTFSREIRIKWFGARNDLVLPGRSGAYLEGCAETGQAEPDRGETRNLRPLGDGPGGAKRSFSTQTIMRFDEDFRRSLQRARNWRTGEAQGRRFTAVCRYYENRDPAQEAIGLFMRILFFSIIVPEFLEGGRRRFSPAGGSMRRSRRRRTVIGLGRG